MDPKFKSDNEWLDDVIQRIKGLYNNLDKDITCVMNGLEIIELLYKTSKVLMSEPMLVETEAPIKVLGDIHAQFQDLNKLFDIIGRVPKEKLMFLGDYVDRGPQGMEIVLLLFAWKVRYPDRIYILRGNHECPAVNKIYGFYNECIFKYGAGIWWEFMSTFNRLPMAGLISKKVLCMHGGLSPEITSLDVIREIPRPCEPLDSGLLIDLVWADPTNRGEGWFHSIRGISYMFGRSVVTAACEQLGISLIIRGHQVVQDGYEIMEGRQLITVFSVPNYCSEFTNASACVCLDADLTVSFQQLLLDPPDHGKANAAPRQAGSIEDDAYSKDKDLIKPFKGFANKSASPKPASPKPTSTKPVEEPKTNIKK